MRAFAFLILMAQPVLANGCHDLWFTRNLVMDRAGYCFGSVLGQAQFDNSDCIGKQVSLAPFWSNFVAQIQTIERTHACRVNTAQPQLDLPDAYLRRQLVHLPIADEFESACLGWVDAPRALFAGHDSATQITGYIQAGDRVGFGHIPVGNWTYVTTHFEDWTLRAAGWIELPLSESSCTQWAG